MNFVIVGINFRLFKYSHCGIKYDGKMCGDRKKWDKYFKQYSGKCLNDRSEWALEKGDELNSTY